MTWVTPGSASMRDPSTRPSLPSSPTAVRWAPGIGAAWYPISSIVRTTRSISAVVAPCRITTSMSYSWLDENRIAQPHADERRDAGLLHCHAVDRIGGLGRGAGVVRDHDELRLHLELDQHANEATDVLIVQRGV